MSINIGGTPRFGGPRHLLERHGSSEEETRVSGRVLLRLVRFLGPYWFQLVVAVVLTLISSGASLLAPYLTKVAIDTNIANGDVAGLVTTALWLCQRWKLRHPGSRPVDL